MFAKEFELVDFTIDYTTGLLNRLLKQINDDENQSFHVDLDARHDVFSVVLTHGYSEIESINGVELSSKTIRVKTGVDGP